jgi:O-antigen ligase
MVAGFIAMLWLVPFNTISMTVSLPFELKLDRIVLPFVVVVWCLALAIGGRTAPRVRLTAVHFAVGTFVAVALLSVLVNVTWLNNVLLLNSSIKGLVLLLSYAALFVIVASVVRPTEVQAFVKYTLILAVVCGLGALWEYRFKHNLFYEWAHMLLPSGLFEVPVPNAAAIDELGRRLTLGPAEAPLELAAMAGLALPIALVGGMHAKRRRDRILYGLAACVLLAAGFTTYRKTAFVVPVVVVLLLAWVQPRKLLRMAPIVPVLLVVVHLLAPQAIGSVLQQLEGNRLASVDSTAHRATAYEAERPLVWTRPALGQGYGSYNGNLNRIFDSQILDSVIETGIIGLAAYLSMMVTVFAVARALFKRFPDTPAGKTALALGVGAMVYFTTSFLYDTMSFPHGPYIFLTYAGFVAVLLGANADRGLMTPLARRSRAVGA